MYSLDTYIIDAMRGGLGKIGDYLVQLEGKYLGCTMSVDGNPAWIVSATVYDAMDPAVEIIVDSREEFPLVSSIDSLIYSDVDKCERAEDVSIVIAPVLKGNNWFIRKLKVKQKRKARIDSFRALKPMYGTLVVEYGGKRAYSFATPACFVHV